MGAKSPQEMAKALRAMKLEVFDRGADGAVANGLRDGLLIALRLSVTKYMLGGGKHAAVNPTRLTIRSGKLRRTVRLMAMRTASGGISGGLEAGDDNVHYAGHETGMTIHRAARSKASISTLAKRHTLGRPAPKASTIQIPARPYMKPAIQEAAPQIMQKVQQNLDRLAKSLIE